jgi:hypothetical protein
MNDLEKNFEQYLKHLDLVKKNEPEKYEFIKEIADSFKDIEISKFIEKVALSFEKKKNSYLKITGKASKEIFLKEQIELYTYANYRFKRFGDYANETFDKYKPVFIEALEYWRAEFQNLKTLPPQPINSEKPKPESLSEIITHEKSTDIVRSIRINYKNIKGKQLKLLLLALQQLNLLPKERIAKKFYNCCKNDFNWDIASYTAMNDYQYNDRTDSNELASMKEYLETLIKPE